MLFAYVDKTVQVGVNPLMDPKQAHGHATFQTESGRQGVVYFQVDQPKRLRTPSIDQIKHMFKQLDILQYPARAITILGRRGSHQVFKRELIEA